MTPSGPTIRPTRPSHLALTGAGTLVVLRLVWSWWQGSGGSLPLPGPVAWASIGVIAVGVAWLARVTRRVLARDRSALDAQQAVTRLLLGKTSQVAGALMAGAYGSLVWAAVSGLPAPLAVERIVHGGIAVVLSGVWLWAGWSLEAACRIPEDPPSESRDSGVVDPDSRA